MMMMTMMAAGGMGGGVGGRHGARHRWWTHDDARSLVVHAGALAVVMSMIFSLFAWTVAPALFRLLGGTGQALANAEIYSHVLFTCSIAIWVNFFLSSLLRGGGEPRLPAASCCCRRSARCRCPMFWHSASAAGPASACGPGLFHADHLGGVGAPAGPRAVERQAGLRAQIQGRPAAAPAVLGHPAGRTDLSFSALTANLTAMMVTGLVGRFGVAALAGYGIGVRLEFMLVPLAFGIGSGLTTLVGVAAGAHDWKRACARPGPAVSSRAPSSATLGWIVALLPEGWARLSPASRR